MRRYINPNPLPPQVSRRRHSSPPAAKGIQHNVPFIRRGANDTLQQSHRLLCRIPNPLARHINNRPHIGPVPNIANIDIRIGLPLLVELLVEKRTLVNQPFLRRVMPISIRLDIEQQNVMLARPIPGADAAGSVAPNYLVAEVIRAENPIHQNLQVMAGGRVAVQIDAARRLQQPPHLRQPLGNIAEVRQHTRTPQCLLQPAHRPASRMRRRAGNPPHPPRRRRIPLPGILKRPHLRRRPVPLPKQDVVVGVAVKRRIQVNQIHAVRRPPPHPVQAIAVTKGLRCHPNLHIIRCEKRRRPQPTVQPPPTARLIVMRYPNAGPQPVHRQRIG